MESWKRLEGAILKAQVEDLDMMSLSAFSCKTGKKGQGLGEDSEEV